MKLLLAGNLHAVYVAPLVPRPRAADMGEARVEAVPARRWTERRGSRRTGRHHRRASANAASTVLRVNWLI